MGVSEVKALTFDVFGTVVDWRSSVIAEARALGKAKGLSVDWEESRHPGSYNVAGWRGPG